VTSVPVEFGKWPSQPGKDALYIGFDSVPMGKIEVHMAGNTYDESRFEKF
jgi:hypothetical protein